LRSENDFIEVEAREKEREKESGSER